MSQFLSTIAAVVALLLAAGHISYVALEGYKSDCDANGLMMILSTITVVALGAFALWVVSP